MVLIGYWDSLIAARLPDKSGSVASYQEAPDKIAVVASDSQDYTRPRSKGIYLLPNLLTTGCLFSAFYAVVAAIDKHFDHAGMAVFAAMIFDTLHGRIALLTRTASAGALMVSRFGYPSFKQFDLDRRIKFVYMLLVPLFFVLIAIDPPTMLLSMFGTYALSAPLLWVGRRLRRSVRGAPAAGA